MDTKRLIPCILTSLLVFPFHVQAEKFRFSWTAPDQATMTCTSIKKGVHSTSETKLTVGRLESGNNLLISMDDIKILSVEGMSEEEVRRRNNDPQVRVLLGSSPDFIVDPGGQLVEITPIDNMIENVIDMSEADPETTEKLRQFMTSPQMKATLEGRIRSYWGIWVNAYNGLDMNVGDILEFEAPIELGNKTIASQVRVEYLNNIKDTNKAHIRITTTVDGENFKTHIAQVMMSASGGSLEELKKLIKSASKTTVVNTITDPDTLTPSKVKMEETVKLANSEGQTQEQYKLSDCTFNWN